MISNNELNNFIQHNLFLGIPKSQDMGDNIALIAMVCKLTDTLKQKKPGMTHYQVIRLCMKNSICDDLLIEKIAILSELLSQGCIKFPDLGVSIKEMPNKIKNLISDLAPF